MLQFILALLVLSCEVISPQTEDQEASITTAEPDSWWITLPNPRFVKKAGGSNSDMAPVGAQLVMVASTAGGADACLAVLAVVSCLCLVGSVILSHRDYYEGDRRLPQGTIPK